MVFGIDPVRLGIVTALLLAVGYIWLLSGRETWSDRLADRFVYGIPWGTLVSIAGVVSFYLFAQSGLANWTAPVTLPFRSWSYFSPIGLLVSGFAHAGPGHLTGNMVGTLVLAPLVEYAWGHYPPGDDGTDYEYPPPGDHGTSPQPQADTDSWQATPWVRALVLFPLGVVAVSLLTSVFAFGWSLGFSGTVYAFGGFAVVYFPIAAIIAMVGFTGTAIVVNSLLTPVVRATAEASSGPPGWWGVNVQAHLLGFLIGAVIALILLHRRNESRRPGAIFFATLLFGLSRGLYIFTHSPENDVFLQLRGVGVIFVVGLAILVTAAVAADSPLPDRVPNVPWVPAKRLLAIVWLAAVGVLLWSTWAGTIDRGTIPIFGIGAIPVLLLLALYPFFPADSPSRIGTQLSRRDLFLFALAFTIGIVVLPSLYTNYVRMSDDPVPDGETITIEGYDITYAENTRHGRLGTNESGVIVVNEQRDIWITAVDKSDLAGGGEVTIPVGGIGWRETVTATRQGWDVVGNDSTYAIDLSHDGETIRAFRSPSSQARATIANKTVAVEVVGEQFRLNVTRGEDTLGTVQIPGPNETTRVGALEFETESVDGTPSVFAQQNGTRVLIAEQE
jgi:membrane associated rhomboid family serine protease